MLENGYAELLCEHKHSETRDTGRLAGHLGSYQLYSLPPPPSTLLTLARPPLAAPGAVAAPDLRKFNLGMGLIWPRAGPERIYIHSKTPQDISSS